MNKEEEIMNEIYETINMEWSGGYRTYIISALIDNNSGLKILPSFSIYDGEGVDINNLIDIWDNDDYLVEINVNLFSNKKNRSEHIGKYYDDLETSQIPEEDFDGLGILFTRAIDEGYFDDCLIKKRKKNDTGKQ